MLTLTTDTNFLMSTFLSACAVHYLQLPFVFFVLIGFFSSNHMNTEKTCQNKVGCGNLTNFLQAKTKDVSDVFLILSDLRRDRLIFLQIFFRFF